MLKVYGSYICVTCREMRDRFQKENIPFELVDITENTANLKEFLRLRDTLDMFAPMRKEGLIGIPFFVEDGKNTFNIEEAISWVSN